MPLKLIVLMKKLKFFMLFGLSVFVCCSEGIKGPPLEPPTIPESYHSMAVHYNHQSIPGIKAFYSRSYKHNGLDITDLDSIWSYRLVDGSIKISRIDILDIYGDTLMQCVLDVFVVKDNRVDTVHIEPDGEYDDVCFWRKEDDFWKLYGNQE